MVEAAGGNQPEATDLVVPVVSGERSVERSGPGQMLSPGGLLGRVLGPDTPLDLFMVGAFFVLYLAVDQLTRAMVDLAADDLTRWSLVVACADRRSVLWLGVTVVAAGVCAVPTLRPRVAAAWSTLDQGNALRLLVAPLIVLLAWKGVLYPFNFFAGQLHLLDRVALLLLAVAALWRPVFLVPFALEFRVIAAQTIFPFGTEAGRNIDGLPVAIVLLVGTGHLLYLLTGRRATSAVVLAIGSAIAAHFYIPGKGKVMLDWWAVNDISNLPMGAYTAGWLGQTDGAIAAAMSSAFGRFSTPIKLATLVLEVGAVVLVSHRRLLRVGLVAWIGFHVVTFISTGYFFVEWMAAEVGLLSILSVNRADVRAWVDENATWARAGVAVAATVGAPLLFHPPGLAWIDAPVSYGYRIEAVGESGTIYRLPASTLAPLDEAVMFNRIQFSPTGHLSGAYGAMESGERLEALKAIDDLDSLEAAEANAPKADPARRARSVDLLSEFIISTQDDNARSVNRRLRQLGPPPLFWSSWSDDDYRFDEPLVGLDVQLITSVHGDRTGQGGSALTRVQPVQSLRLQDDGSVLATPDQP